MDHIVIRKENGAKIPCVSSIKGTESKIVIIVHGLCSSKESPNTTFMMEYFAGKGIGAFAYDQPGHGEEEAAAEELCVANCLDSLSRVEEYLRRQYPDAEICYFGSSYGGFILAQYLVGSVRSGRKAFMRCCAVNFPQMILGEPGADPDPASLAQLEEKGYIEMDLGVEKPARFTRRFLEELQGIDLWNIYDKCLPDVKMHFVHGEKDPVVPLAAVQAFTEKFGYPLTIFPGEGHSISDFPDDPAKVAALAYDLFHRNG